MNTKLTNTKKILHITQKYITRDDLYYYLQYPCFCLIYTMDESFCNLVITHYPFYNVFVFR